MSKKPIASPAQLKAYSTPFSVSPSAYGSGSFPDRPVAQPRQKLNILPSAARTQDPLDSFTGVRNWADMQNYLHAASEYQQRALAADAERRRSGQRVAMSGIKNYNVPATESLIDLVGRKNVGVKYVPHLQSEPSARAWLEEQKMRASPKDKARWDRYGVQLVDLDNDPETMDNVVVYSDVDQGRIKSVDGYETIPYAKKRAQKNLYILYPTKSERAKLSSQQRRIFKAYDLKNPTPEDKANHPYEQFEKDYRERKSAFDFVRESVTITLKALGLTIYSKDNPGGNIAAKHFMPIVQKVSTLIHRFLMTSLEKIPKDYNWEEDVNGYRTKRWQKFFAAEYGRKDAEGVTWVHREIASRAVELIGNYTVAIANEIDAKEGGAGAFKITFIKNSSGLWQLVCQDAAAAINVKRVPFTPGQVQQRVISTFQPKSRARPPPKATWGVKDEWSGSSSSSSIPWGEQGGSSSSSITKEEMENQDII